MALQQINYTQIRGGTPNVMDFGAVGNGTTDDTTAIQNAVNSLGTNGGTLYIPKGTYLCSSTISMAEKVTIIGEGPSSSVFTFSNTGAGLKMTSPINSSTGVYTGVYNLGITCTNSSNTDGGYVDVGGTYVNLQNVAITGFKYGVIFDQTELGEINLCYLNNQLYAGIWLVNGSEYSAGASALFTNRISVQKCQINQGNTVYGILDDGGYSHNFDTNNFNGCLTHVYVCGVSPLNISNSEMESAASTNIVLNYINPSSVTKGQCTNVTIQNNIIAPTTGHSCINGASVGSLVCINNYFGNSSAEKIIGASIAQLVQLGNISGGGGALVNATITYQFSNSDIGTFTPAINFSGASVGVTYSSQTGSYQRIGNVVTFTISIVLTNKGSSTGNLNITGLPYLASNSEFVGSCYMGGTSGLTSVAPFISNASSSIQMYNSQINASANVVDTNITNSTTINITGSYLAQ